MLRPVDAEHESTTDDGPGAGRRSGRLLGAGLVLGLLTAGAVLAILISAPGGDRRPPDRTRAFATAEEFVDSVGVNVHMSYNDTPYGDLEGVRAALKDLGVRHVRDGIEPDRPDQYRALRELGRDGLRATLIVGKPGTDDLLARLLDVAAGEVRPVLEALEGPNEYDVAGDDDWPASLREYQDELVDGARSRLRGVPIVGPSLVERGSFGKLGDTGIRADLGNIHPYPGGQAPEPGIEDQLALAVAVSGDRPVVATESGYHTAIEAEEGQPPVSERAAGIYLPRLYLEYFRRGIVRTFAYELIDEFEDPGRTNPEANFGLLRRDFSPKPAFAALANLMRLMQPAAGGPPQTGSGRPELRVEGAVEGIRQLLLERSDGAHLLALWRDASVWDTGGRVDRDPPPRDVQVRLGHPVARVEVHRPSRSSRPEAVLRDARDIDLELTGDVAVLALEPARGS